MNFVWKFWPKLELAENISGPLYTKALNHNQKSGWNGRNQPKMISGNNGQDALNHSTMKWVSPPKMGILLNRDGKKLLASKHLRNKNRNNTKINNQYPVYNSYLKLIIYWSLLWKHIYRLKKLNDLTLVTSVNNP